jgi:hypothetical protein
MIQNIVPGFQTTIEKPQRSTVIPRTVEFVNPNPQCGPWPFTDIQFEADFDAGHAVFCTDLSPEFIRAQILPRGRPHISLLHVAIADDAIAASSFQIVTQEPYGQRYRYLELGACAGFHQEAFFRNSIREAPFGTLQVDGYRIRWQCLRRKPHMSLIQRGIVQVGVFGIIGNDEVQIVSVEVEYFRRRGVLNVA